MILTIVNEEQRWRSFSSYSQHSFDKLDQARKQDRKVERVALTISLRGIKVFINHDFINHQESTYYICSLSSSSLRPWSIITRRQFSHSGTITITMTISRCSINMVILDQQWHWSRWSRLLLGLVPWTFPSTGDECREDCEDVMPMTKVMMKVLRVSYCSADLTYDHVFAFIVTNRNFSLS